MNITVHLLRKGVRLDCVDFKGYQTWYDMRSIAKDQIKNWFIDYFDREIFTKLTANPNRLADESANDMTLDFISGVKEMARMADPKIRPIKINGKDHYVLVMHPYVARALRTGAEWKAINEVADIRGDGNKLFTGALGMYDGVILYEHENVAVNNVAAPTVANNVLLGAQAGVLAEQRDYFWKEDTTVDYGMEVGIMAGIIRGFEKTIFTDGKNGTPEDYGLITLKTKCAK